MKEKYYVIAIVILNILLIIFVGLWQRSIGYSELYRFLWQKSVVIQQVSEESGKGIKK